MSTVTTLTSTQRETLEAIRTYVATHGHAPTVRELGELLGLVAPSSALARLRSLEGAGAIVRDAGRARVLRITSR